MPPITRNQFKKSNLKNEPYSKENRLAERRTALLDLVENNVCITYLFIELILGMLEYKNVIQYKHYY